MKNWFGLTVVVTLGVMMVIATVKVSASSGQYCFVESIGPEETTICAPTASECRGLLSAAQSEARSNNNGSQFTDGCANDLTANAVCATSIESPAGGAQCFSFRRSYSQPIGATPSYTVCSQVYANCEANRISYDADDNDIYNTNTTECVSAGSSIMCQQYDPTLDRSNPGQERGSSRFDSCFIVDYDPQNSDLAINCFNTVNECEVYQDQISDQVFLSARCDEPDKHCFDRTSSNGERYFTCSLNEQSCNDVRRPIELAIASGDSAQQLHSECLSTAELQDYLPDPTPSRCLTVSNSLNSGLQGELCFDDQPSCVAVKNECESRNTCAVESDRCSGQNLTPVRTQGRGSDIDRVLAEFRPRFINHASRLIPGFSSITVPDQVGVWQSLFAIMVRANTSVADNLVFANSSQTSVDSDGNNGGGAGGDNNGSGGIESYDQMVPGSGKDIDCGASPESEYCLDNPIEADNIFDIIATIVIWGLRILLPLAVLMIIYGGLQFVIARGNESKITNAKQTFTNIMIGVALIVGANVLVEILRAVMTSV